MVSHGKKWHASGLCSPDDFGVSRDRALTTTTHGRRNERSASTQAWVSEWFKLSQIRCDPRVSIRVSIPRAACPDTRGASCPGPELSPAARLIPSPTNLPSGRNLKVESFQSCRRQHGAIQFRAIGQLLQAGATLPRISTTFRSGRCASNCAFRRVLLVATVAPGEILDGSVAVNPRRLFSC